MKIHNIILTTIPALFFTAVCGAGGPIIQAERIVKPIIIDGRLDDAGWSEATRMELRSNKTGRPNKYKTEAWLGYNENDILIAFRCEEPDVPVAGKTDGEERGVFAGDTVEVFLDINHDRTTYWQFVMDSAGLKYDGYVLDSNAGTTWEGKTAKSSGEWTAEFRIPFQSLGITPETASSWTGNLYRTRQPRKNETAGMYWAYAPAGMFHNPEKFAEIANLDLDFKRFYLEPAHRLYVELGEKLQSIEKNLDELSAINTGAIGVLRAKKDSHQKDLSTVGERIGNFKKLDDNPLEELTALDAQVNALSQQVALIARAKQFGLDPDKTDYLVGTRDSMSKVYSNRAFKGKITNQALIHLARNEYEGLQIVVLPTGKNLKGVEISASPLLGPDGKMIAASDIDIRPLLEVIIDNTVANDRWPEVLGRSAPVDIKGNAVQPFFITVYARKDLSPGNYSGTLTVRAKDSHKIKIDLTARVWDFTLPKETHCHTGLFNISDISICDHFNVKLFSPEHEKIMLNLFEYFARHRIQPGEATPVSWRSRYFLWRGELDPELKKHWKYKAIADRVDPGYKLRPADSPEAVAYWEKWGRWWRDRGLPIGKLGANMLALDMLEKQPQFVRKFLQAHWRVIEKNGWQKYTYIRYPDEIDEPGKNGPETVRVGGEFVKKYAPGLLRHSVQTARTPQAPYLDYVDLWFLYAASYEKERDLYDRLKREDRSKVFWLSMANHIGADVPDVAPRISFMVRRKYGFTGTGLWTSTWNYGKPKLVDGVFHVASKNVNNARSTLIWPAENGVLFSRRLELIRDGLEDYEYHWLLENLIARADARSDKTPALVQALSAAGAAYKIDDALVSDILKYSKSPDDLLTYRARMADAIVNLNRALNK